MSDRQKLLKDTIELIEDIIGYVPDYFMDKYNYQEDYDSIMKRYEEKNNNYFYCDCAERDCTKPHTKDNKL